MAITMFSKKPKVKNVGQIIASLGVLFIGLGTMSAANEAISRRDLVPEFAAKVF